MSQHDNSLIKTPRQLIIVIALAFIVPVILIILLATYVVRSTTSGGAGSDAMSEKAIAERMRPVGFVAFADSSASEVFANRRSGLRGCVQRVSRSRHRGRAAHRRRRCMGAAHQARIRSAGEARSRRVQSDAAEGRQLESGLDRGRARRRLHGQSVGGKIQGACGTGGKCSARCKRLRQRLPPALQP